MRIDLDLHKSLIRLPQRYWESVHPGLTRFVPYPFAHQPSQFGAVRKTIETVTSKPV